MVKLEEAIVIQKSEFSEVSLFHFFQCSKNSLGEEDTTTTTQGTTTTLTTTMTTTTLVITTTSSTTVSATLSSAMTENVATAVTSLKPDPNITKSQTKCEADDDANHYNQGGAHAMMADDGKIDRSEFLHLI